MKQSRRRALSALLTLAMILSLLVIPAGAVTATKEWVMSEVTETIQNSTGEYDGLQIDASSGKWGPNSPWVQVNSGTIIKVPVSVPSGQHAVIILGAYSNSFLVGGTANTQANGSTGTREEFDCADEGGYVTIKAEANSYLDYIGVGYADGVVGLKPSMNLDSKYADMELKGNPVEVTPTVENGTATGYTAVSASEAVATAEVADGKVVITPKGVGDTTVTVSATLADGTVDPVSLPVSVWDAETISVWNFKDASFQKTANKNYRGLTLASANANSGYGVGTSGNLTIPVAGRSTITVKVGYTWDLSMENGTVTTGNAANPSGDTSGRSVVVKISYTGEGPTATLSCSGSTYIESIEVEPAVVCDVTAGCTLNKGHAGDCVTTGGGDDPTPDDPSDKTVAAGTYSFATSTSSANVDGIEWVNFEHQGNQHGMQTIDDTEPGVVKLNLKETANVMVQTCGYGTGVNLKMEADKGTVTTSTWPESESTEGNQPGPGPQMLVSGAPAGVLTITLTPQEGGNGSGISLDRIWLHVIEVAYPNASGGGDDPSTDTNKIKVWDFAGKQESNTSLYENRITAQTWKDAGVTDANADKLSGDYALNGVTWHESSSNGRLYSNVSGVPTSGATYGVDKTFSDGFKSAGGVYAGGTSGRYLIIHGLKAGDKVKAYVGSSNGAINYKAGTVTMASESPTEFAADEIDASTLFALREFVVAKDGDFKIYATDGKTFICRVAVVKPVSVSGTVTLDASASGIGDYTFKFLNQTTQDTTPATLKSDGTWSAKLVPGFTYTAILEKTGYGFTNATKQIQVTDAESATGKSGVALSVEAKQSYTLAGQVTGFAAGYDLSQLKVTLEPDAQSAGAGSLPITLTLDSGLSYNEATLEPGVTYTAHLSGVDDYKISSGATITSATGATTVTQNIAVVTKTTYAASGKLVTLDMDDIFAPLYADSTYAPLTAPVSALSFTILDAQGKETKYVYPATVTNGSYTVSLRPGSYIAKATVSGWSTKTHVVVSDKAVSKDLLFVADDPTPAVAYKEKLTVGPNGDFKTINGALNAIKGMTRTADQRVTVEIAPGTYREQIAIGPDNDGKFDNITFANADPTKEVKLTWYYGLSYSYYSGSDVSSTENWYDAEKAFDKYQKTANNVARWGCTVRVRASGFRAENITFENSFNYEVTAEEVVDGVTPTGSMIARKKGVDVTGKDKITERAAAIWMDSTNNRSDKAEFYRCKFLSSQDTLGTGDRAYFKECYIEGMTDYICGPGSDVFDNCQLNWKGYKGSTAGGYITAPQTKNGGNSPEDMGYLFRNCTVTGDTKLSLGAGGYARMWGGGNTVIYMLNTTLKSATANGTDLITANPWNDMGNGTPVTSATGLHEYGTKLADGTAVSLSIRPSNTVLTEAQAKAVKAEDFFGDWTPYYYTPETATSVALDGTPNVTDNGDINLPKAGHTLTVSYTLTPADAAANDASTIQWFAVKDGKETLVKTAATVADKTYQIQKSDLGAQIKVTVTPKTIGGLVGEAKSFTVAEAVVEGYDDPSGVTDPVLGSGVNIYLAGDSTVKDYSANGMWNNNALQGEGSWGEWLPQFFNDKVTVVNYAQGGRTTRQFIEGDKSLEKIDATMKEGDFLFIQFGHNDCHTGDDRYVPLGIAKNAAQKTYAEGGVYPDTVTYSSDLVVSGKTILPAGTYTTYTGYLKQYIAVTEAHGATAVLATPVSRLQYSSDGKSIKAHHDATAIDGTSDNEYCKAVKWVYDWAVAQGYQVEFLDNYALTEKMFLDAWANGSKSATTAYQAMKWDESKSTKYDGTHNSKLGGLMEAALVAQAIQNKGWTISKAVVAPTDVLGEDVGNKTAFTIDADGKLAAFDNKNMAYTSHATYWEGYGQKLFDAIAAKAAELNPGGDDPTPPDCQHAATEVRNAKEATCAEAGYTGDTYCKTCNTLIQKGTAIAKIPHTYGEDDVCTVCGAKKPTGTSSSSRPSDRGDSASTDPGTTTDPTTTPAADDVKVEKTETATKADGTKVTTSQLSNGSTAVKEVTLDGAVSVDVTNKDGEKIVAIDVPAEMPETETKFEDVDQEHWAAEAIDRMAALGMVRGVADKTYDTDGEVTRATLATMLFRFANGAEGKTSTFADVKAGDWYADAIGWAAAAGVVTGYSETAFGPNDQLTREQMAVMLLRFAKLIGMDSSVDATAVASFTDADSVNAWAADGMAWCVKNGIINGTGDNTLAPAGSATRAQTAVMLDRFIGLLK